MDTAEPLSRDDQRVVIVGAGLAGVRVAEGVRQAGFTGSVLLINEEQFEPYDRPPLSKAVLKVPGEEARIALSRPGAMAADNIEIRSGVTVTAIDRASRSVLLADGETLGYDRLVLATGSKVRTLDSLPPGTPGVHYLRSLDDALKLRAALTKTGARLVVIGGGVIGLEAAASAREMGCEVKVIEAGSRVMARSASPAISVYFEKRHRAQGVDIRLGVSVVSAHGCAPATLVLSDGEVIEADAVLVGVGVTPNLTLAQACGLETRPEGVMVDQFGATGDPFIFAAGEVAFHHDARSGRHERRETWAHAAAHGEHVGVALIRPEIGYAHAPSYWSDQYDVNLQAVGNPCGDTDILRGDPTTGHFLVIHLIQGQIAGVSAINAVRDLRQAKKLIGLRPNDPQSLADTTIDLSAIL